MTNVQRSGFCLLLPSCYNLSYGISEQACLCDVPGIESELEALINASVARYCVNSQSCASVDR